MTAHGFIPVPNVASVEMIYVANSEVCENQFYVQKGSPFTLSDLQALRDSVDDWDDATWKSRRTGGASLVRIRTRARDTATSPTEDYFLPTPRPGTRSGTILLPNNVSYCVKLVTGLAGRSFRGRLYFVGMNDTCLGTQTNQVDVTWANSVVSGLNTLLSDLATDGYTLGVVSYYNNGAWRDEGVFTEATGYVAVDYNVDSARRRLKGRGS